MQIEQQEQDGSSRSRARDDGTLFNFVSASACFSSCCAIKLNPDIDMTVLLRKYHDKPAFLGA